ncbi:winged helix-turn-helix domain-containing protein [Clostridium sp. C105KSO13]|uniref:winged helix-turn-helix domain-containing protein n=1 Tax=Clostridium sp. C105KSO13 TaxID=1776045 RepID=UPI00074073B5|nr:LysR family transcriptional regulator [Clostridium sp. C105KSO13]CUX46648.1 DNA-binding transcriptional regulator ModE [Clostridium sp. C105KSO13]
MFHPFIQLKIYNEELVCGPGLITLLEFLRGADSMKGACAEMGMSYSKGWKIVNRAERELGYDLLVRQHGGSRGGKCELTEKGESLVTRFRQMEKQVNAYAETAFEEYFPEYLPYD